MRACLAGVGDIGKRAGSLDIDYGHYLRTKYYGLWDEGLPTIKDFREVSTQIRVAQDAGLQGEVAALRNHMRRMNGKVLTAKKQWLRLQ